MERALVFSLPSPCAPGSMTHCSKVLIPQGGPCPARRFRAWLSVSYVAYAWAHALLHVTCTRWPGRVTLRSQPQFPLRGAQCQLQPVNSSKGGLVAGLEAESLESWGTGGTGEDRCIFSPGRFPAADRRLTLQGTLRGSRPLPTCLLAQADDHGPEPGLGEQCSHHNGSFRRCTIWLGR